MEPYEGDIYTGHVLPTRQKRRPALACEQCRRRKIKYETTRCLVPVHQILTWYSCRCDRNAPCRQCVRTNLKECLYVHDTRSTFTRPPFEAEQTRFLVMDRTHESRDMSSTSPEVSGHGNTRLADAPDARKSYSPGPDVVTDISQHGSQTLNTHLMPTVLPELSAETSSLMTTQPETISIKTLFPSLIEAGWGIFKGTRFYGQSHWISSLQHVHALFTQMGLDFPD